ncbi:hypothetical protein BS78_07G093200 [Paspalum vaginatum]|nr:hypothetical protein BS78_07G093200 [Paspalum vaginatum]
MRLLFSRPVRRLSFRIEALASQKGSRPCRSSPRIRLPSASPTVAPREGFAPSPSRILSSRCRSPFLQTPALRPRCRSLSLRTPALHPAPLSTNPAPGTDPCPRSPGCSGPRCRPPPAWLPLGPLVQPGAVLSPGDPPSLRHAASPPPESRSRRARRLHHRGRVSRERWLYMAHCPMYYLGKQTVQIYTNVIFIPSKCTLKLFKTRCTTFYGAFGWDRDNVGEESTFFYE